MPDPDWRSAADYAPLLALNRPGFAWEFLRRNSDYRCDAAQLNLNGGAAGAGDLPRHWGLTFCRRPGALRTGDLRRLARRCLRQRAANRCRAGGV